jgi:uncharacterized protein YbjT (DUF2867 family)
MDGSTILLAGGTGDLGTRIARHLVQRGASVRALVRPESRADGIETGQSIRV